MLSYGSDMTLENNPLEVGLDRFFEMGKTAEYLAREALEHIVAVGPARKLVRVAAKGEPVGLPRTSYALKGATGQEVGFVTSMVYSPRLEHNIGFGFVPSELAEVGGELDVVTTRGTQSATIVDDNWST